MKRHKINKFSFIDGTKKWFTDYAGYGKDEQPKAKVKGAIMDALDQDLPESYDKEVFNIKTDLLLTHFIDMAVQGYGWFGGSAA